MRKCLILLMVLTICAGASTVSFAQITGSAHDFSGETWSGGQICLPCHTPHNADNTVTDSPLWNHEVTATATYTLYSGPGTLDATDLGQPDGVSLLCLSCHDGTVAVDSFGGATGTTFIGGSANFGTDLSDDHPISFTYDSTLATTDGELVDPSADGDTDSDTVGMTAPYLPLFSSQLECASCHDVHNGSGEANLLIKSNTASALCLTCHAK